MLTVKTANPAQHTPVEVLVDNSKIGLIQTNTPEVVFLEPYLKHAVAILPEGKNLYQYDKTPRTVVLYKGNIQRLTWDLSNEYILFTRVVDAKHHPIANALLEDTHQYDATDALGEIQVALSTRQHHLTFSEANGQTCGVNVPAVNAAKGYASVDNLVCV